MLLSTPYLAGWALFAVVLALFGPYLWDPYRIRKYPGPVLAKFTYGWLLWIGMSRRRSEIIHDMHKKYGSIIRISPSEISFSRPEAYSEIYSFTSRVTKSSFYDVFATIGLTNVFTARSKTEHGQKRKLLHRLFTAEVSRELSLRTYAIISTVLDQWGTRYASKAEGFDCVAWMSWLSLDVIGEFTFGDSFGLTRSASDTVTTSANSQAAFADATLLKKDPLQQISLIQVVSKRETYNYFVGMLPSWWKIVGRQVLRSQFHASQTFSGFIAHKVAQRVAEPLAEAPRDLVGRFLQRVNAENETFRMESLVSELITIVVAGSDTTRNSLLAAIYFLANSPGAQSSLQKELDAHMTVPVSAEIEALPFLGACLNETLRLYSPVPGGLPRTVPETGMSISGQTFVGGTTIGVPIYTLHRDESVWGAHPEEFRPERWLLDSTKTNLPAFKPFSDGPTSCIGKHLALLQLRVMLAAVFKRFEIRLEDPARPLQVEDCLEECIGNGSPTLRRL
ncbi:cytochrome P450 monooxygenase [Mycena haematopus]|nr:cytochrome P450 monooxygenase [Mycena haematopus]